MTKKTLAWQVNEPSEGHSCIVFHHHGLAARREGAGELGEDFEYVECFRAPHFDRFAEQGYVPVIELLKAGWWFECVNCGNRINDDDDRDEDEVTPLDKVVTTKEHAYCNQGCKDAYDNKIKQHNIKFEQFKVDVANARPDLDFYSFTGEWPQLTLIAKFKFAGAQYGGSVRDFRCSGDLEWFVANGDKEAWEKYELDRIKPGDVTSLCE